MASRALHQPPSLPPLFAKAVVSGALRRGTRTLQGTHLTLASQAIDAAHLAAYQRLCEYRVGDILPPTYLHVLSFPLSVLRMTEGDFPFPLLGLVHVQNVVNQVRPVRIDETVSLDVWSDNLRPHPAGQQIDLVSEASIDGEVVWSETSTYLRRGTSSIPKEPQADSPPLSGATSQWRVPVDIGRKYAAVSGDRNPIHLHNLSAKALGFPKAIAHGMWLKARTLAAFEGRLPDQLTVEVAFKTPVFLPSTVELAAHHVDGNWTFELHNARSGKPHLLGEIYTDEVHQRPKGG
jgi:acyl dehydratase